MRDNKELEKIKNKIQNVLDFKNCTGTDVLTLMRSQTIRESLREHSLISLIALEVFLHIALVLTATRMVAILKNGYYTILTLVVGIILLLAISHTKLHRYLPAEILIKHLFIKHPEWFKDTIIGMYFQYHEKRERKEREERIAALPQIAYKDLPKNEIFWYDGLPYLTYST